MFLQNLSTFESKLMSLASSAFRRAPFAASDTVAVTANARKMSEALSLLDVYVPTVGKSSLLRMFQPSRIIFYFRLTNDLRDNSVKHFPGFFGISFDEKIDGVDVMGSDALSSLEHGAERLDPLPRGAQVEPEILEETEHELGHVAGAGPAAAIAPEAASHRVENASGWIARRSKLQAAADSKQYRCAQVNLVFRGSSYVHR